MAKRAFLVTLQKRLIQEVQITVYAESEMEATDLAETFAAKGGTLDWGAVIEDDITVLDCEEEA